MFGDKLDSKKNYSSVEGEGRNGKRSTTDKIMDGIRSRKKKKKKETTGGSGHRSRYLSHAKRALYHLS